MNHHVAAEDKEHTHVLIIGNGFDLEHGLKTSYPAFLDHLVEIVERDEKKYLKDSPWWGHFSQLRQDNLGQSNSLWCDLEQEIGEVVEELDRLFKEFKEKLSTDTSDLPSYSQEKFRTLNELWRKNFYNVLEGKLYSRIGHCNIKKNVIPAWEILPLVTETISKRESFQKLFEQYHYEPKDLDCLVESVKKDNIYSFRCICDELVRYVREEMIKNQGKCLRFRLENCFKKDTKYKLIVLDFNYTRVFEMWYVDKEKKGEEMLEVVLSPTHVNNLSGPIKFCYVHGCMKSNTSQYNTEFLQFKPNANPTLASPYKSIVFGYSKKYDYDSCFSWYTKDKQREIVEEGKKSGREETTRLKDIEEVTYETFSAELKKSQNTTFHIIGHSLGEIDHDILREVLGFQNSRIRVYYHNKEAHCRLKKNIIKIIGKEDVKKRVEFIYQYDPQEGVFCEKK